MSFYHRPAIRPAVSSAVLMDNFITDEKTGIVRKTQVPAEGPLPTPDVYDVDKMIKAGIDLKQLNTKILGLETLEALPEVKQDNNDDKE